MIFRRFNHIILLGATRRRRSKKNPPHEILVTEPWPSYVCVRSLRGMGAAIASLTRPCLFLCDHVSFVRWITFVTVMRDVDNFCNEPSYLYHANFDCRGFGRRCFKSCTSAATSGQVHPWTSRKITTLRCIAKLSPLGWIISDTTGILRCKSWLLQSEYN